MAQNKKDVKNNSNGLTPYLGDIAIGYNCARINVDELVYMVRFRINQVDVLDDKYFN